MHLTAAATGRQYDIHAQTVRNWLRQNTQPVRAYQPYFDQILTCHRTARRDYPTSSDGKVGLVLHFRRAGCNLNLFSDECLFNLSHADGRERVYPYQGERFADACVIERDRFGGGSVFVYVGITYGNMLTHSHTMSPFDAPEKQTFRKYCGKRRNCS